MKKALIGLFLVITVLSDLTCESNQVYIKFTKVNSAYPDEESFKIFDGETELYTSPYFTGTTSMGEACIPTATNNQYTIKLLDQYGDAWSAGAYLKLQGAYGNYIFVGALYKGAEVSFPLSLYTPVMKNSEWKMVFGSVTGSWTELNYDASSWTTVTLGSVDLPVSGTQYFRKTFTGIANMAAYELSMKYRFGIVAYVNGEEVYRDNMPAGPITSSTSATGSYALASYHNVIRPGSEVSATASILAVEIHFNHLPQSFVDFDAYLATYTPNIENSDCMMYADQQAVSGADNAFRMWDFSINTSLSINEAQLPVTAVYSLNGAKAYINAVAIYTPSNYDRAPMAFKWKGAMSSSSEYTTVIDVTSASYAEAKYHVFNGYFNANVYNSYRLEIISSSSYPLYAYEIVPCICKTKYPTAIEFEQSSYTAFANYQSVSIRPTLLEFTNCQITPSLPSGLSFDPVTCTLSGTTATATPATTYTVTSTVAGNTFTGSFSLEFQGCNNNFIRIVRTYKANPHTEYFSVMDLSNNATILSVAKNSGQPANVDVNYYLCTTAQKIQVETFTSSSYWQHDSYLYLYNMFNADNTEIIGRVHRDHNYAYPTVHTFNIQYAIPAHSNWYYKMGEVPANWYNAETAGWTEKPASGYPASTNQIQLYKKTFTVASINEVAGLVLSLKYQYGVLVYLNGHEVFRKGITGALSASSMATTSLESVKYRQISLPLSGSYKGAAFTNFVQTGSNTVAIALVAAGPAMTASTFDCALRLMGSNTVYRNFGYTVSYEGADLYEGCNKIFDNHYSAQCYSNKCSSHAIDITFDNDRHEWISSIAMKIHYTQRTNYPTSFTLMAKNAEDEEWTTIKTFSGLSWSQEGQRNRYWTFAGAAYNQYRITNVVGQSGTCSWKFNSIELIRDSYVVEVPALTYPDTTVFRFIEMAEVYANSDYYSDFTIAPPLPAGISIDYNTGMISGTATAIVNPQVYTIHAKKFTGDLVTATLNFGVSTCSGSKSLITLVIRADSLSYNHVYFLYNGIGTEGTVVSELSGLPVSNTFYYTDFCLDNGFYTFLVKGKYSSGWDDPAGYYVSVDEGEMKITSSQIWSKYFHPVGSIYSFSSYLPFQVEYSDWKVYKNAVEMPENWADINYDDASWGVMKAADIGTNEAVTTYIRKEVMIDHVSNYTALNVRVKYTGGVVAYFNGRKVARFNLEENFINTSESLTVREASFSKFHVILETNGIVAGKNIMAFEIHRPVGTSSSVPVVFDATGVFDVNECAFVFDSYSSITGTDLEGGDNFSALFDTNPSTGDIFVNSVDTYLEWVVDNLEGSRFNTFGIGSRADNSGWGFSLYARDDITEPYNTLLEKLDVELNIQWTHKFETPVAIASYNQFRFEIDVAAEDPVSVFDFFTYYCRASGESICPGVDNYPSVGEGQISPGECEYGYYGYSYRECHDGVLGEVKTDRCFMKIPADIQYDSAAYTLVLTTNIKIDGPKYRNFVTEFYLGENVSLPKGLTLDPVTGSISGVPTEAMEPKTYTIFGKNEKGAAETTITLSTRKGECKAESNFSKVSVGETAVFDCSTLGSYIGTMTRECLLGVKDGEWQKANGMCMSYSLLTVIIVVLVVIIAVIVFFSIKNKKVKAVGGTKGKKAPTKTTKKNKV